MARFAPYFVITLVCGLLPAQVRAHLDMTSPVSRYGRDAIKIGPCGVSDGLRSANVNYFEPGETIEVEWNEYVDHRSHYRIAFDEDGDDDFVDPSTMLEYYSNDAVLLDQIEDEPTTDPIYRVSVTLPDVECDNCTLQVIQVMYDKPPYQVGGNDIYYQCADLVLRKGGVPPDVDAGTDAGTESDAGSEPGGAGTVPDPDPSRGSGCRTAHADTGSLEFTLWLLALVAMWALARSRRLPV